MSSRTKFNALARALGINATQKAWKSVEPVTKHTSKNKYGARKTEVDGIKFDSKKEAEFYLFLKERKARGLIVDFERQKKFELVVNGRLVGRYTCDFFVSNLDLSKSVIEVKGGNATKTEAYRLRKKLFEACHGMQVTEV